MRSAWAEMSTGPFLAGCRALTLMLPCVYNHMQRVGNRAVGQQQFYMMYVRYNGLNSLVEYSGCTGLTAMRHDHF